MSKRNRKKQNPKGQRARMNAGVPPKSLQPQSIAGHLPVVAEDRIELKSSSFGVPPTT